MTTHKTPTMPEKKTAPGAGESASAKPAAGEEAMTARETAAGDAVVSRESLPSASAGTLDASMSAIASSRSNSLNATGSAVGIATVEGDASANLSAIGVMTAKGNASMSGSYASALVAGDHVTMSLAASPAVIARKISFDDEHGGALIGVAVGNKVKVRKGFIGVLLAGNADVAEDTRVLLSGRALIIVAAALLGGFALVAVALMLTGRDLGRQANRFVDEYMPAWLRG